jgi:hypothetical protein
MPPPLLTAETALFRSGTAYAAYDKAWIRSTSGDVASFVTTNCDAAYDRCAQTAQDNFEQAMYRCNLAGLDCWTSGNNRLKADLASCAAQFVCASSGDCQVDRVSGQEPRCCPGQQACAGHCVPWCPPRKTIVVNDASCSCVCDPFLTACEVYFGVGLADQWIRDPDTCLCRCLTDAERPCAVTGAVRDQATCVCACPPGWLDCNGTCKDVRSDPMNCGICGNACQAGEGCCDGACVPLNTDANCGSCHTNLTPVGLKKCCMPPGSLVGVPTQLGTNNDCGDCGDACHKPDMCCPPDQLHPTHWCGPGPSRQHCGPCGTGPACSAGEECCYFGPAVPGGLSGYRCRNVQTSVSDCGGCDRYCYPGRVCSAGTCRCPTGQIACGQTLPRGPQFCCNPGRVCSAGTCRCPTGQVACGQTLPGGPQFCCDPAAGQACCSNTCVDTRSDPNHCGSCTNACLGGKTCQMGQCVCAPPKTDCSGICVDLQNDPNHCGSCTNACPAGKICQMGQCVCAPPKTDCSGVCVDLQNDPDHCGSCTQVCHDGQTQLVFGGTTQVFTWSRRCASGQCACPSGMAPCGKDWCMPTPWPGTNRWPTCCSNMPWWPGHDYACPPGTTCCNIQNPLDPQLGGNGTGWNFCCFSALGP